MYILNEVHGLLIMSYQFELRKYLRGSLDADHFTSLTTKADATATKTLFLSAHFNITYTKQIVPVTITFDFY